MKIGQSNKVMNQIVDRIMSSQDLLKLIYYPTQSITTDGKDIYSLPDLTSKQKKEIINNNIYKYRRVPLSDSNEMKTYLSLEYDRNNYTTRKGGQYYKECRIALFIITNQSLAGILQGARLNEIEDCINDIFQCENIGALKDCCVEMSSSLGLPDKYIGRAVVLKFIDTNDKMFGGGM